RVGFMARDDADGFVDLLAEKGLTPYQKGAAKDVALLSQENGPLVSCDWLKLGRRGEVVVAWLAGAAPGDLHAPPGWSANRSLRQMSPEEMKQGLEFVRSDDRVDVYRDKTTGQEYYVGRTADSPDRARHNQLYQQACDLIKGLIILGNEPPAPLDP